MARKSGNDNEPNKKGLSTTIAELQKQFGAGSVIRMGDAPREHIQVISTGVPSIDIALGRGGFPKGRIIEIYGPESSGKTTLALNVVAQAQKEGGVAAFVDAEHALDPDYAEALGVNVEDLILSQPDDGEQALEITNRLVQSGEVAIVVVDSVAALTPRSEIEGEMGDANVGKQARLMSQALRKLTANVQKTGTTLIFINQLREKIGVMFGSPETTTGGKALKFYASVRVDIRAFSQVKQGEEVVGNKTRVKIVKNKVARPFRQTEVETRYGVGFLRANSLIESAKEFGFVEKSGGWLKYQDKPYRAADLEDFLTENPEEFDSLYAQVMAVALPNPEGQEEVIEEGGMKIDPRTGEVLDEPVDEDEVSDDEGGNDDTIFDG